MNFVYNLKYMGIGMLGIIIVIGIIILVTTILNKVTKDKQ
ncbi:MAG: oxaloacetate decarboxylase [Ruminococcaceae bacterium]|nr:oxaloacetate decarboxylase [Oscillospiraceae bacterium]